MKKELVPKPGEFIVISTNNKYDPEEALDKGLHELLDVRYT